MRWSRHSKESGESARVSFEEFKLYYESAELVTERRLSMNRWNYSVSVAILIAISGIFSWMVSRINLIFVGVCAVVILAMMAAVLCTYWIRQIDNYKALNNAKFAVLEEMAKLMVFDEVVGAGPVRSFQPFVREWQQMQGSLTAAPSRRLHNVLVLSSSGAEYFIPRAFRVLYALIIIGTVTFTVLDWSVVSHHIFPIDLSVHKKA